MDLRSAFRSVALIGLVALFPACAADAEPDIDDGTADLSSNAPLSDAALAKALARTPANLSQSRARQLVSATVNPLATTARLKMLNDFIGTRLADRQKYPSDAYGDLAGAMEAVVWQTPRDLVATPAGFGGQKILTTISFYDNESYSNAAHLKVVGVATADYELEMTVAGYHLTIDRIPAGSSATETAKLIGDALDAANQKIADTIDDADHDGFDQLGGDHYDAKDGIDDVEVSTQGDSVEVVVAIN